REHLFGCLEGRSRESGSDCYAIARVDRSLRKKLRRERHAGEGVVVTDQKRVRTQLLRRNFQRAPSQSQIETGNTGLPVSGLRSISRSDELVRKSGGNSPARA